MTASTEMAGVPDRLAEAALALVQERGWHRLSLAEAALRAGISLADARECFPDKAVLLAWLMGASDRHALAQGAPEAGDPARDRLFEILMRRFDALQTRRAGLVAILHGLPRDPFAAACLLPHFAVSMSWMLEAAGISASGPLGGVRIKAMSIVYLNALRVWVEDDSADMSRTMAAVDSGLRQVDRIGGNLPAPLRRVLFGDTTIAVPADAPPPAEPA